MADEDGPLFPEIDDGISKIDKLSRWADTQRPDRSGSVIEKTLPDHRPRDQNEEEKPAVKFAFSPEINQKIIYWSGDITKIDTDAIVNSTNESLNEKNGLSERIIEIGGDELVKEIISLEGCRTGEAKITSAYSLPCRYIVHTVGPRFNLKYKTAAESALHNCYRSTMELIKEYELSSIAFTVVNSARRGYPPDSGAHLALRTIRRFLERYGKGIEAVVLCVNEEQDRKPYDLLLPLYFPRSQEEAEEAARLLPEDIGNEMGEPVQEERKIRIRDIPGSSARMNIPVVSEDNPLRNWADPSRGVEEVVPSFAKMQGDHDVARREEIHAKSGPREQSQQNYLRLLRRAKTENLSEIASKNLIYQSGTDSFGRAIVCVNGKYFNPNELRREQIMLYLIFYMDSIASKDYVIVYYNAEATSDNHPDLSLIREIYGNLHPKYRRNLRLFYLVHPTWWVKLSVTIMNTFFTSDIRRKMKNVETLSELFQSVPSQQLNVPDYVLAYDKKLTGGVAITTGGSSRNTHDEL